MNVLSILTLGVTGYYIGNPFMHAYKESQYVMGWMRFIHFTAAYVFVVSLLIRLYWAFAGNKYASWKALFPVTGDKPAKLIQQMLYYAFLAEKPRFGSRALTTGRAYISPDCNPLSRRGSDRICHVLAV